MTNEGPDQTIPNKQMQIQSQNQRKDFLLSKYVSGIGKYHRPLNRTGVLPERRGEIFQPNVLGNAIPMF